MQRQQKARKNTLMSFNIPSLCRSNGSNYLLPTAAHFLHTSRSRVEQQAVQTREAAASGDIGGYVYGDVRYDNYQH